MDSVDVLDAAVLHAGLPPEARRPWTRAEFERAGELGFFGPKERLELIGGEVIRKITPQCSPHATAVCLVAEALRLAFPSGHHVRVQLPLVLADIRNRTFLTAGRVERRWCSCWGAEQCLLFLDEWPKFLGHVVDVVGIERRIGVEYLVDGAEEIVEGSDRIEAALRWAAMAATNTARTKAA